MNQKAIIAMSGGVDSSVAGILAVQGAFIEHEQMLPALAHPALKYGRKAT